MDLQANVPRDIWDLVPDFVRNRHEEVERLREALAAGDMEMLTHLAERMYALGNPYGFRQITTFGRELREALAHERIGAVRRIISQYKAYLAEVSIDQVEVPVLRSVWRERAAERRLAEAAAALPPPDLPERRKGERRKRALRGSGGADEAPA